MDASTVGVGVGGGLVGVGVASTVGRTVVAVGSGGGVGRAGTVAEIGALTGASTTTLGTAVGLSVSGCCVGAEELGTAGGVATEAHPITRKANSVKSNALNRCIPAPLKSGICALR